MMKLCDVDAGGSCCGPKGRSSPSPSGVISSSRCSHMRSAPSSRPMPANCSTPVRDAVRCRVERCLYCEFGRHKLPKGEVLSADGAVQVVWQSQVGHRMGLHLIVLELDQPYTERTIPLSSTRYFSSTPGMRPAMPVCNISATPACDAYFSSAPI